MSSNDAVAAAALWLVTASPAAARADASGTLIVATVVHVVPSFDHAPVKRSPLLVSRSHPGAVPLRTAPAVAAAPPTLERYCNVMPLPGVTIRKTNFSFAALLPFAASSRNMTPA